MNLWSVIPTCVYGALVLFLFGVFLKLNLESLKVERFRKEDRLKFKTQTILWFSWVVLLVAAFVVIPMFVDMGWLTIGYVLLSVVICYFLIVKPLMAIEERMAETLDKTSVSVGQPSTT